MPEQIIRLVHITAEARFWGFFTGQSDYMKAHGFEFHAISSPGEMLDKFAMREGIKSYTVEISRSISPLPDLISTFRLWRTLRSIDPDIVEAHTSKAGLLGMIAAWLARVPTRVYHNHGMAALSARGAKRLILRLSEKVSCRLAHRVIYVAPSLRGAALAENVCEQSKAKVILSINGLDSAGRFNPERVGIQSGREARIRYSIPPQAPVLGFVGRLLRIKGIYELMTAWEKLSARFPTLHLLMVGEFDARDPVPTHVQQRMFTDARIHLVGHVDETPPLYAAMDLLVLPSYHEGLPYALLEASAMGLPVVATRIPGTVDAVEDGITGLLVAPRDSLALVNAIASYLENPELRLKHGRNGREYVARNFSQERVWGALYDEYQALLARNGHKKS